MEAFTATVARYRDVADFCTVYIAEAHASDEWSLGEYNGEYDVAAPKELQQRVDLAINLRDNLSITSTGSLMVVDGMENTACEAYHAMPERLYVVLDGVVVMQGGTGPHFYSVDELNKWFEGNYPAAGADTTEVTKKTE